MRLFFILDIGHTADRLFIAYEYVTSKNRMRAIK